MGAGLPAVGLFPDEEIAEKVLGKLVDGLIQGKGLHGRRILLTPFFAPASFLLGRDVGKGIQGALVEMKLDLLGGVLDARQHRHAFFLEEEMGVLEGDLLFFLNAVDNDA